MSARLQTLREIASETLLEPVQRTGRTVACATGRAAALLRRERTSVLLIATLSALAFALASHPPRQGVRTGEMVVRRNRITGEVRHFRDGSLVAIPGIHEVRRFSLREESYRARESVAAATSGEAPFRSAEGVPVAVDLSVRYAIDPVRWLAVYPVPPVDVESRALAPALRRAVADFTASRTRTQILATRRRDLERELAATLRPRLASLGLALHGLAIESIDFPAPDRAGLLRVATARPRPPSVPVATRAPPGADGPATAVDEPRPATDGGRNPLRIPDTLEAKLRERALARPAPAPAGGGNPTTDPAGAPGGIPTASQAAPARPHEGEP
ncbi:MAG: hypothetical protein JSR54_09700 [Proteobacteria bacterium]|nr:hypothetical protein [Pseudomonadota bacterium]